MIPQLPLSIEPLRDEGLPSLLVRASDLTGYPVRHLYPDDPQELFENPGKESLRTLGLVLGINPAQLRRHTLKHRLRGRYDGLTSRDRRDAIGLRCPGCGSSPLWSRVTLASSCLECALLLTRDDHRTPAPREALAMQRAYMRALSGSAGADVQRIERLWWLLEFRRCTAWPDADPQDGTRARLTRGSEWKTPRWIAEFAVKAWPSSAIPSAALIGHTGMEFLAVSEEPARDLDAERARLHDLMRRAHLTAPYIPNYVLSRTPQLDAGCHVDALGHAMSRALIIESVHAHTGERPNLRALHRTYRPTEDDAEVEIYTYDLCHSTGGLRRLQDEAYELTRSDRVDYEHHRDGLRSLRSVPAEVLGRLSIQRTDRTARTAAAWIWVELTHGTLRHSPHYPSTWTTLRRFDAELRPEDRLTLIEYGQGYLSAISDDVARQHHTTEPETGVRTDAG